jgi:serine/threonine protein kinase
MPASPFAKEVLIRFFPELSGFDYIGAGTFKTVYRVTLEDGQEEVLKIIRIPMDQSSDEAKQIHDQELGRAKRETRLLEANESPFIVKVGSLAPTQRDLEGAECLAYTEELLPGRDLSSTIKDYVLARVQPDAGEVKELLKCLVLAVQSLAKQSAVHRDIKPANVFDTGLEERPFVLLDLGIAFDTTEPGLTANKLEIPMTPLYVAPEMFNPDFRENISPRSDLYSAALTVFEYAAGRHPLAKSGDDLRRTITRVMNQEPLRLEGLRPDLPKPLTNLINQFLKKKPSLRPSNFEQILTIL